MRPPDAAYDQACDNNVLDESESEYRVDPMHQGTREACAQAKLQELVLSDVSRD